jgi:hypothetical protein
MMGQTTMMAMMTMMVVVQHMAITMLLVPQTTRKHPSLIDWKPCRTDQNHQRDVKGPIPAIPNDHRYGANLVLLITRVAIPPVPTINPTN